MTGSCTCGTSVELHAQVADVMVPNPAALDTRNAVPASEDTIASVFFERHADTTRVTSTFPLNLGDYQIGGLTKMLGLLRMDSKIQVRADLRFVATPPTAQTSSP